MPNWTVAWTYWSRARLMGPTDHQSDYSLPPLMKSTSLQPGAIVFVEPEKGEFERYFSSWLKARHTTYKVESIHRDRCCINSDNDLVLLEKWPRSSEPDVEASVEDSEMYPQHPRRLVKLIEKNKGKSGALNVFIQLLRLRAKQWANDVDNTIIEPVQTFLGIVDSTHMLAEPHIFWNEALPFMATTEMGKSIKEYGKEKGCLLVQYPQHFSNINRDDYLDNKNSSFFTLWQTLRDHSKTIISSGTNAIWDVTNPKFEMCTHSCAEEISTSHENMRDFYYVHLQSFVAHAIARDHGNTEAAFVRTTVSVELFWGQVFSKHIWDYLSVFSVAVFYGMACMSKGMVFYYIWMILWILILLKSYLEKSQGARPFRGLCISAAVVLNSSQWFCNLTSPVWMVLFPMRLALKGEVPLATNTPRFLTYCFMGVFLYLPPAIITDRLVNMVRLLSPKTVVDRWDFSMVLFRSLQVYSVSAGYTVVAVIVGTVSAFKLFFKAVDNSHWTAQNGAVKVADYFTQLVASLFFLLQLVFSAYSIYFTNKANANFILGTIFVCGLNLMLCMEVTMFMAPYLSIFAFILRRPVISSKSFALIQTSLLNLPLYFL